VSTKNKLLELTNQTLKPDEKIRKQPIRDVNKHKIIVGGSVKKEENDRKKEIELI
jgi:hypothetical protein